MPQYRTSVELRGTVESTCDTSFYAWQTVQPLQALAREAAALERRVSDLVNEAYGLTPDEVALMWQTAPPGMPVGPG